MKKKLIIRGEVSREWPLEDIPRIKESLIISGKEYIVGNITYNLDENIIEILLHFIHNGRIEL